MARDLRPFREKAAAGHPSPRLSTNENGRFGQKIQVFDDNTGSSYEAEVGQDKVSNQSGILDEKKALKVMFFKGGAFVIPLASPSFFTCWLKNKKDLLP